MGIEYKMIVECDVCLDEEEFDVYEVLSESRTEIDSVTDGYYRLHGGDVLCEDCYNAAMEEEDMFAELGSKSYRVNLEKHGQQRLLRWEQEKEQGK